MMRRNPFSTCFIRPGKIPFVFPAGSDVGSLVAQMLPQGTQGAIVGPHGSGKSTLLEMLSREWPKHGIYEQRVLLTASARQKSIPWRALDDSSVLVIDGFEQLAVWERYWIGVWCWRKGARLLVTCHQPCGMPVILQTQPTWPLAFDLAKSLLTCDARPYENEMRAIWEESPGDIRAYFFRLYHWCESRGLYLDEDALDRRNVFSR